MNFICRQVNCIRNQNTERDLDGAVIDPPLHVIDDPANQQTEADTSNDQPQER